MQVRYDPLSYLFRVSQLRDQAPWNLEGYAKLEPVPYGMCVYIYLYCRGVLTPTLQYYATLVELLVQLKVNRS